MITLKEVRENPEVEALIRGAQKQLDGLRKQNHCQRRIIGNWQNWSCIWMRSLIIWLSILLRSIENYAWKWKAGVNA